MHPGLRLSENWKSDVIKSRRLVRVQRRALNRNPRQRPDSRHSFRPADEKYGRISLTSDARFNVDLSKTTHLLQHISVYQKLFLDFP